MRRPPQRAAPPEKISQVARSPSGRVVGEGQARTAPREAHHATPSPSVVHMGFDRPGTGSRGDHRRGWSRRGCAAGRAQGTVGRPARGPRPGGRRGPHPALRLRLPRRPPAATFPRYLGDAQGEPAHAFYASALPARMTGLDLPPLQRVLEYYQTRAPRALVLLASIGPAGNRSRPARRSHKLPGTRHFPPGRRSGVATRCPGCRATVSYGHDPTCPNCLACRSAAPPALPTHAAELAAPPPAPL